MPASSAVDRSIVGQLQHGRRATVTRAASTAARPIRRVRSFGSSGTTRNRIETNRLVLVARSTCGPAGHGPAADGGVPARCGSGAPTTAAASGSVLVLRSRSRARPTSRPASRRRRIVDLIHEHGSTGSRRLHRQLLKKILIADRERDRRAGHPSHSRARCPDRRRVLRAGPRRHARPARRRGVHARRTRRAESYLDTEAILGGDPRERRRRRASRLRILSENTDSHRRSWARVLALIGLAGHDRRDRQQGVVAARRAARRCADACRARPRSRRDRRIHDFGRQFGWPISSRPPRRWRPRHEGRAAAEDVDHAVAARSTSRPGVLRPRRH